MIEQIIKSKSSKEVAEYLRNVKGFNIVPIKYKTKVPELNSLSEYFNKKCDLPISDNQSIAILHGKLSGTYAIDLDHPDIITDLFNDANLILKNTLVIKTPKQGYHIIRAIKDNDFPPLNIKLINHEGKKIDIKTEGGYTLLPPSVHDEVNGNYQFVSDTLDPLPVRWSDTLKILEDFGYFEEGKLKEKMFGDTLKCYNNWPLEELLKGGYTKGERRRKQNSLYVKMRKEGKSENEAVNMVLRVNESCRPEPLDDNELKHNLRHSESFYQKIKDSKLPVIENGKDDKEKEKSNRLLVCELLERKILNVIKSKDNPDQIVVLAEVNGRRYYLDISDAYLKQLVRLWSQEAYHEVFTESDYNGGIEQYYSKQSILCETIKPVYKRFAYDTKANCIYYDPNRKDCKIIKITADGFDYIDYDEDENPIFIKNPSTWISSGQVDFKNCYDRNPLEEFAKLFHVGESDKVLFKAHLITEFLTGIPIPIMVFNGEQGTAKTTLGKMIKFLIDPDRQLILAMPEDIKDLGIALCNRAFTFFDNVSGIRKDQSDCLCRSVTGSGLSMRTLYTTKDETTVYMMTKCGLNGISSVIDEPDLLQRSIIYELSVIPDRERLTDEEVLSMIEDMKPELLGQIFNTLSKALHEYQRVRKDITEKPRMASFALWAEAIAQCLGYEKHEFFTAYLDKMTQSEVDMIDRYPLLGEITAIIDANEGNLKITASDLYKKLGDRCIKTVKRGENYYDMEDLEKKKLLPRDPERLGKLLRSLAPILRSLHYDCVFTHESLSGKDKARYITLMKKRYTV